MSKYYLILIPLFSIVLSSCFDINQNGEYIFNLNNEFEISMLEVLGTDNRDLAIHLRALDEQECNESELLLNQSQISLNTLKIELIDILIPDQCEEGTSYPSGSAVFDVIDREYLLDIEIKDLVTHNNKLSITENAFHLELSDTRGLIPVANMVYKIPNNFIWGYVYFENPNYLPEYTAFIDTIRSNYIESTDLTPGNYSYFEVSNNGSIYVIGSPLENSISFAFKNVAIKEFSQEVMSFKEANPGLQIHFYASDGSVL